MNKNLIVFASGTPIGGGSGVGKLCENIKNGILKATIVAIVSQYPNGGVKRKADFYGIPFIYIPKSQWNAEKYQEIIAQAGANFVALSGWVLPVRGVDPKIIFNIHPGPLPAYGGKGMYGHFVHEAVIKDFHEGKITHSAVSMHFVTDEYDKGPVFFEYKVKILPNDTPETLGARVNKVEHEWQSRITNKVLQGDIAWDGINPSSLVGKIEYMD